MTIKLDLYANLTFEFIEAINSVSNTPDISALVVDAYRQLGFEYLTIWALPAPGQPTDSGVLLNTRPADYVQRYIEEDQIKIDPAVTELQRTLRPYSWSDIKSRTPLTKKQLTIIDEASEFDVNDGMVVPIITYGGSMALVSPCGRRPDLSTRARSAVEIIAVVGHQAIKKANWAPAEKQPDAKQRLTRREREILQWVACGKSDDEISDILHISRGTVTVHFENAKRKLQVYKRTSAVVEGLKRGEIDLP
jgi:LuxR family transcriptional regulator, quorum-sensing system regulator BjaR1